MDEMHGWGETVKPDRVINTKASLMFRLVGFTIVETSSEPAEVSGFNLVSPPPKLTKYGHTRYLECGFQCF